MAGSSKTMAPEGGLVSPPSRRQSRLSTLHRSVSKWHCMRTYQTAGSRFESTSLLWRTPLVRRRRRRLLLRRRRRRRPLRLCVCSLNRCNRLDLRIRPLLRTLLCPLPRRTRTSGRLCVPVLRLRAWLGLSSPLFLPHSRLRFRLIASLARHRNRMESILRQRLMRYGHRDRLPWRHLTHQGLVNHGLLSRRLSDRR